MDCIFCSIIAKKIPSKIVFESEEVLAFKDIQPKAASHFLFIPKQHIERLDDLNDNNVDIMTSLYKAILEFAKKHNLRKPGFSTKIHVGEGGGQEVFHLHVHLLSNKKLDL